MCCLSRAESWFLNGIDLITKTRLIVGSSYKDLLPYLYPNSHISTYSSTLPHWLLGHSSGGGRKEEKERGKSTGKVQIQTSGNLTACMYMFSPNMLLHSALANPGIDSSL